MRRPHAAKTALTLQEQRSGVYNTYPYPHQLRHIRRGSWGDNWRRGIAYALPLLVSKDKFETELGLWEEGSIFKALATPIGQSRLKIHTFKLALSPAPTGHPFLPN